MKTKVKLLFVTGICAVAMMVPMTAVSGEDIDQTLQMKANGLVQVENLAGSIEFSSWDRQEVHVRGEAGDDVEEVEITSTSTGVSIRVHNHKGNHNIDGTDLYLRIPHSASIEADSVSSDITVNNNNGERIQLNTVSGDLEIDASPQLLELQSVSGDVEFEGTAGRSSVETVSGEIALVGPSGGGKSTLADLIPRFYDITGGSLRIDGIELKKIQIESLRGLMGIVSQESILFNDTVFNNIAFGIEDPDPDEVERAAKIANAHEFIIQMENGYASSIGEGGTKLSGGQKQRLSIARAIMKNPQVLILDEATSALDSESETLVQEAIDNLMQNRTSIVIAHRLSTIQNADEIVVIQEGKIIERGTHRELIAKDGIYKKLSAMQSF